MLATLKSPAAAASYLYEEQFGLFLHVLIVEILEDTRQSDGFPVGSEHAALLPVRRQDGQKTVLHRPPALCSTNTRQDTNAFSVNFTPHSLCISHNAEGRGEACDDTHGARIRRTPLYATSLKCAGEKTISLNALLTHEGVNRNFQAPSHGFLISHISY